MTEEPERFTPTSGRWTGGAALVLALGLVVLAVLGGAGSHALSVALGGCFLAALAWVVLLRPRVSLTSSTLELRNMLDTIHVPLAAIEGLVIRQVTAVRVGEKRYVCSALGRSLRSMVKGDRRARSLMPGNQPPAPSYVDFVESRIQARMDDARAQLGIRRGSSEQAALAAQVRRRPAIPEIAALAITGVAFLATLMI